MFALAIVIGYYVIGNVHHALHTPLMSVTNAISGIIVVGALLQIGHGNAVITARRDRRHPAGQHQRLRWLRGDPPHARHVLQELIAVMSVETAASAAYLVAALLFILALAGLSRHETAKAGNAFGIAGMVVALVATIALAIDRDIERHRPRAAGRRRDRRRRHRPAAGPRRADDRHAGADRAAALASSVSPPCSSAGTATSGSSATRTAARRRRCAPPRRFGIHHAEVFIGVFIGAVTFTGSIIAFLKLSARINSKPLVLPGKNALNLGALVLFAALTVWFCISPQLWLIIAVTLVALLLGLHLVASIGGGDMPVVVSMLNSYSGWAAAASGFLLDNDLLIITGALVGSSGAYLSYIMCKAMNRSFVSVIAGGFGIEAGPAARQGLRRAPRDEARTRSPRCSAPRARSSSPPATAWPSPRRSTASPS